MNKFANFSYNKIFYVIYIEILDSTISAHQENYLDLQQIY